MPSLRLHHACFHRPEGGGPVARLPAMLATITDLEGRQTGTHRTWLRPDGSAKADIDTPRRAMGALLGKGVRFGAPADALIAGEGIETVLSVRSALPEMPAVAALSSGHLAAIRFPAGLRRLYVLRDSDPAGAAARDRLEARAAEAGIEAQTLTPRLGDFNDDLRRFGLAALQARLPAELIGRTNDIADRKRVTRSSIVEAAVESLLSPDHADMQEAALTRRLDRLSRQVARLERDQRITTELALVERQIDGLHLGAIDLRPEGLCVPKALLFVKDNGTRLAFETKLSLDLVDVRFKYLNRHVCVLWRIQAERKEVFLAARASGNRFTLLQGTMQIISNKTANIVKLDMLVFSHIHQMLC